MSGVPRVLTVEVLVPKATSKSGQPEHDERGADELEQEGHAG
jgi:hypothetical protein